jgi:hypothetical protein
MIRACRPIAAAISSRLLIAVTQCGIFKIFDYGKTIPETNLKGVL